MRQHVWPCRENKVPTQSVQAASAVEQASVEEVWGYATGLELELPELQHLLAYGELDELLLIGL